MSATSASPMSATGASPNPLARVSLRRRRTDQLMRGMLVAGTVLALIPLVLIIFYLISKGISTWSTIIRVPATVIIISGRKRI